MGVSTAPENGTRALGEWLLVVYFALLFFGLGAGLLESLLNYPMWRDMGARMSNADFIATRRDHTWRVFPLLVIPLALRVPATLALIWRGPAFVQRRAVLAALAAQLVGWASSGFIQIPIQVALTERGFSDELFARLIVTDLWLRVLPFACEAAVGLLVLRRLVRELAAASS
jgi:hypothetical protein